MSTAICGKGHVVRVSFRRGVRLADMSCPDCGGPLFAAKTVLDDNGKARVVPRSPRVKVEDPSR
jgi:hypothetical protein